MEVFQMSPIDQNRFVTEETERAFAIGLFAHVDEINFAAAESTGISSSRLAL
jgi:hypothetical protein